MTTKFNKITSAFLALIMIFGILAATPFTASAAASGNFEYEILDDGTISITKYHGSETDLAIPETLDGYTVTSIGWSAFSGCKSISSITIPDSVTEISYGAFGNCTNLANIYIPDSVTSIWNFAFANCTNLETINIPDSVLNFGAKVFYNTKWYSNQPDGVVYADKVAYEYKGDMPENTSIILKDGTKSIANNAFSRCTNLTSITLPESLINIGQSSFSGCTGLTNIIIPDNVKSITVNSFMDCINISSVTIPYSVEHLGWGSFGYVIDDEGGDYKLMDDFIIYGYTGSEAEIYAKDYNIQFVSIGEVPKILGDVNGDGTISIDDVTDIQKYLANLLDFTDEQIALADVDKDEKVSIDDATLIQKSLAGLALIE